MTDMAPSVMEVTLLRLNPLLPSSSTSTMPMSREMMVVWVESTLNASCSTVQTARITMVGSRETKKPGSSALVNSYSSAFCPSSAGGS